MLKNLFAVLFLCAPVFIQAQYLETFSTPNKGYLLNQFDDFTGVDWTMSPWANQPPAAFGRDIADYFQTNAAGVLECIDLDQEVCWESPQLNTAAAPLVSLAVDLSWIDFDTDISGNPCTEASLDYIKVQYSVDGGAWTTLPNAAGGNPCATIGYAFGTPNPPFSGAMTVKQDNISGGSTLRIRVCVNTNSNAELVTIDNVSIPETGVTMGCTAPSLSTTVTNITCGGPTSGAIDLSVSGGTPGYTFQWSNASQEEDPTGLAEGTYTVTVTDAASCTATASTTVDTVLFSVNIQVGNTTCDGLPDGEIDLIASGGAAPYTYNWSDLPAPADPEDRTGLATGTYTVTVTDSGVCSATISATVGVAPPGPYLETFSADGKGLLTGSTCNGLDATTCTQNNFAGVNWSIYGLDALLGIEPDDYFSTANGVLSGKDFDQIICWESPAIDIDPPGTGVAFSVDLGWAGFDQEPPGPDPLDLVADHIDVEYSVDGGPWTRVPNQVGGGLTSHTIVYINGSGSNLSNNTTVTVNDIVGSVLRIRVCGYLNADAETMTIDNVSVPSSNGLYCPLPELGVTATDATCFGGSDGAIDLTVSGGAPGFTYAWSNGADTEDLSGVPAGTYTVTVTDNAGYTAVGSVMVGEGAEILLAASVIQEITCIGDADGALEIQINGGQPLYTVGWSNGANTNPATSLSAGVYSATVTDANGCSAVLGNIVLIDPPPITAVFNPFDEACPGGEIMISLDTVFGGSGPPYQYQVDGGIYYDPGLSIPVTAGFHAVTYIDRNICEMTDSIFIAESNPSNAMIAGPDTTCAGFPDIYDLPGNFSDYLWAVSGDGMVTAGQGTAAATVTWPAPGAETLTVYFTNENGCADSAVLELNVTICVGTKEATLPGVRVGPNPFGGWVAVQFDRPVEAGGARLRLLNGQGCMVREQGVSGGSMRLETADLPVGVYLLQVLEDGKFGVWKLVKAP